MGIFAAGMTLGFILGGLGMIGFIWMYESVTWEDEDA